MSDQCTEVRFFEDVKDHIMEVIKDDGLYRHIRFREPGTMCMHFDFITWPGYLCYTGDMGTYVFTRLSDMFEFFRTDQKYNHGRKLGINLGYWSEKLEAVDGGRLGGKAKEFDEGKFYRVINEYRINWMRSAKECGTLDKDGRRELWEAVNDEVLRMAEDDGHAAQHAAYNFNHGPGKYERNKPSWEFQDLFEHDFTEYTNRFVWCCYALAWGIQKYDLAKESA